MQQIKICGVKDPETAAFAAREGADFIGIVFAQGSKRYVPVELAVEIAAAAKESGAKPVGVFVDTTASAITEICDRTGITYVQPYGLKEELPERFQRFYVNTPDAPLREGVDYLLMESASPGSALKLDWDNFVPPKTTRWFLAGGLTVENVQEAIRRFNPYGVDVSSGVEINGRKERDLIRRFIHG